jgi:hypothetical protein
MAAIWMCASEVGCCFDFWQPWRVGAQKLVTNLQFSQRSVLQWHPFLNYLIKLFKLAKIWLEFPSGLLSRSFGRLKRRRNNLKDPQPQRPNPQCRRRGLPPQPQHLSIVLEISLSSLSLIFIGDWKWWLPSPTWKLVTLASLPLHSCQGQIPLGSTPPSWWLGTRSVIQLWCPGGHKVLVFALSLCVVGFRGAWWLR